MSHIQLNRSVLMACLTLIALTGMSAAARAEQEPTQEAQFKAPPVVAIVNGVEITRKELDFLYSRTAPANLPPEVALERKKAILTELISSEALAQKAAEAQWDKTADFEMQMAIARRSALAEKVELELVRKGPKVSQQNALDYINTNPTMFADRQLLTLERLNLFKMDEALLDQLDKASDDGAGLSKLEKLAHESRAESRRQVFNSHSNRIDPKLLKALLDKPYKPVVIKFNDDPTRGTVLFVHSAVPAPLTGQQAMQEATIALASRQSQVSKLQGTQAIVSASKVVFYGEFAGTQLPASGETMANSNIDQLFAKPLTLKRKLVIGAALAGSMTLLLLTLLMARRYWQGDAVGNAGKFGRMLQGLPLVGGLFGKPSAADELSLALASSSSSKGKPASWYGKLILLTGLAACAAVLGFQVNEAFGRLQPWQAGASITAGVVTGGLLSMIYSRLQLKAIGHKRRWVPVSAMGLLLLAASAAGIAIS